MYRPRMVAHTITSKQQARPHLVHRARYDSRLQWVPHPGLISKRTSAHLVGTQRLVSTSQSFQPTSYITHHSVFGFAQFPADSLHPHIGFIYDHSAIHDEENPSRYFGPAEPHCKKCDADARCFTARSGQIDHLGPVVHAYSTG